MPEFTNPSEGQQQVMSPSLASIVKLNGENYSDWAFVMKLVLKNKGLWSYVDDTLSAESLEVLEKNGFFEAKNEEALMILVLSVEPSQLCYMRSGSAHKAWCELKEQHMNPAAGYRADLVAELCTLRLDSSSGFEEHYRKFNGIVEKLEKAGTALSDIWGLLYLRTLPRDFDIACSIIKQSREMLSLAQMKAKLQLEIRHEEKSQSALAVRNRPAFQSRQGKSECFYCGQEGHWKNNCPKNKYRNREMRGDHARGDPSRGDSSRGDPSRGDSSGGNSVSLAIGKGWAVTGGHTSRTGAWYWDSGATTHICSDRSMFSTFIPLTSHLEVADGRMVNVLGKGLVKLGFSIEGSHQKYIGELQDTLYAPDMKRNLISAKQLAKQRNIYVSFGANDCILEQENGQRIQVGRVKDDLYEFVGSVLVEKANLVSEIWHKRLGHISKKTLEEMVAKGLVQGVDLNEKPPEQLCSACTQGKSTRLPFSESETKSERPLQLIHSDVCGPMEVPSLSGKRYFVTFIDDYSKYTHLYFLDRKSQVLDKFKEFVRYANNLFAMENYRVSTLRSDNGGEYNSGELACFCEENGIIHQYTVPYTPEQNGVAERYIRTVVSSAISMLSQANLDKMFWAEAVAFSTHIRNRVSSRSLDGKTPYELWSGRIPNLSHIRTFGSVAWTHVPKELHRGKLNARSLKGILVGFSETSKAYRIYSPKTKNVYLARDVAFDESILGIQDIGGQANSREEKIVYLDARRPASSGRSSTPMDYSMIEDSEDRMSIDIPDQGNRNASHTHIQEYRESSEIQESSAEEQEDSSSERSSNSPPDMGLSQNTQPVVEIESPASQQLTGYHDQRVAELRYISDQSYNGPEESQAERPMVLRSGKYLRPQQGSYKTLPSANAATNSGSLEHEEEPTTLQQAKEGGEWSHWHKACLEELESLDENNVWEVCKLPVGRKAVGSKWVFKKKYDQNGVLTRYKARLVAQGYTQTYGIDYEETFAPVVRFETIRSILALAVKQDWELYQLDIKTAFLYGQLDEEIYMKQPPGFADEHQPEAVCRLKRSLYGLKQSPRCWNAVLHSYLERDGFEQCPQDHGIYKWIDQDYVIMLAVYVDDMIIAGNNKESMEKFKERMKAKFKMSDIGDLCYFLGIEVKRDRNKRTLHLSQTKYIKEILWKYKMMDCNPTGTPYEISIKLSKEMSPKNTEQQQEMENVPYQNVVGSLMYLVTATRPDIAQAVGEVSRFNANPGSMHWVAVKRILRYLKGTSELGILYNSDTMENDLCAYSDADWGGNIDDRRSTSGYVFLLANGPITWKSQKQQTVALSSTEAEYIALSQTVKECIWLRSLLKFLVLNIIGPTVIKEDNQSSMKLAKNAVFHARTKHIDIRYHFTREVVERQEITMEYCPTSTMIADMLTKYLPLQQYKFLRLGMGMKEWLR
jgi:hypothetical protein